MKCPLCGSLNADEWEKCVICGSPLHQSSSPSPEQYVLLYKRPEEVTWRRWLFSSLERARAMAQHFQARGFETRIMYIRPKPKPVERRRRMLFEEIWREVELARQGSHSNPEELPVLIESFGLTELAKPENAKWLALLIDTEGKTLGWAATRQKLLRHGRTYIYRYYTPYIGIEMSALESAKTVQDAAKLMGWRIKRETRRGVEYIHVRVLGSRVLVIAKICEPYFDKFRRMPKLLQALFKNIAFIPRNTFIKMVTELFGRYLRSYQANEAILKMTESEYQQLILKAESIADKYTKMLAKSPH
ncbi:MAG: hypothetical protein QXK47_03975 [Candidatus Bathyarchaeia archaeon]